MMAGRYFWTILLLSVSLSGCVPGTAGNVPTNPASSRAVQSDQQWQAFLSWWPGDYDNSQQVSQNNDLGAEELVTHQRLFVRRVELPAFGEHVYYAEWQTHDSPEKVLRQRIYAFEREDENFKLILHIFPNDTSFIARTKGAYADPTKLAGVTPPDMLPLPGCEVHFGWQDGKAVGAMRKQSCKFPSPLSGTAIYSWSQMRIQPDSFWYLDGWYREDDSLYRQWFPDGIMFEKRAR